MSKVKFIVTLLAAAMALSALAASTASAAGSWFVNGTKLPNGSKAALASTAIIDESAFLNAPSLGVRITCSSNTLDGSEPFIQGPNTGGAKSLTFLGCSEIAPSTCKIETTEIPTEPVTATLETSGGADRIRFVPQSGTVFATIIFKGTCAESGEQPINGKLVAGSSDGQSEKTTHLLEGLGTTENNSLELFKSKAYLEGGKALLKLASGQTWSFK